MATHGVHYGLKVCAILLPAALTSASFRSGFVAAQTGQQSFERAVKAKRKHFLDYEQDFVNFGQSTLGTDEYEISMGLVKVADETGSSLNAVHALLKIYGELTCDEDRTRVRPLIQNELDYYSKQIEPSISEANLSISHTHMPGIAAEGTRMRDDLREVKGIFDSIKLR